MLTAAVLQPRSSPSVGAPQRFLRAAHAGALLCGRYTRACRIRRLGLEYDDSIDLMADADLRARVVALLEQHGMTTLAGRSQLEALEAAVAVAQDGSDLPSALIHPDCQLSNAIRDPRGRISLIDWEGAGVGPRLWPLGLLLFSAVVRCVEEPCVESAPCRLDLDRVAPV